MSEPMDDQRLAAIADRAQADRYHYDAEFSAQARTDVPALLAEVERLRAALSSATDVIAARDDEIGDWSAKNAALRAELAARSTCAETAKQVVALRNKIPSLADRDPYKNGYDAALLAVAMMIDPEVLS
ncbi:hypothetical protein ACWGUL_01385 [Streptomyces albidoflavus]